MEIKVFCCKKYKREIGIIRSVIETLNCLQRDFVFQLKISDKDICDDPVIEWDSVHKEQFYTENGYFIYITKKPFRDNWFSHEGYQYSIITMNTWEESFAPPSLKAYIIYQIAQSTLGFYANLDENISIRLGHKKSKGCIFDFCEKKTEIKLGMLSGAICSECRSKLLRFGIKEQGMSSIEKMLEYVRSESIGRPLDISSCTSTTQREREKSCKIFISHSSNDVDYVSAFVDLLKAIGIQSDKIICSSIPPYCVPLGSRVYDWLVNEFQQESLHVIYMLSDNYYRSPSSLNEMGAAWALKQKWTGILMPGFQYEQIDGCIDSTQIGIKLGDSDRSILCFRLKELKDELICEFGLSSMQDEIWEGIRNEFLNRIDTIALNRR